MEDTYKIYKIIKISNENNKLEPFNQKDEKHSFENNVQNNVQKLKATFRHDEKQISKVKPILRSFKSLSLKTLLCSLLLNKSNKNYKSI